MAILKIFLFFTMYAAMAASYSDPFASEHVHRLSSSATVSGFVGGESHDSYVIHVCKGQTMTVRLSWVREQNDEPGENHAEFWISESNYHGDGVSFGTLSEEGKRWTGKIHKTRDYYICVVAHPSARYSLTVRAE